MTGRNSNLVFGRAGMDLAPESPGTAIESAAQFSASLGGSAANIAVGIVRLGGAASLVSAVSSDPVGTYCISELKRYGVDTDYIMTVSGEHRTSLALTEARVENHRTVIYRNGAADFAITEKDIEAINFSEFARLILTGTALAAEPSRSAAFAAIEAARAAGCDVALDIDYRPYSWASADDARGVLNRAADGCSLIVGNEEEFGFLAGGVEKGMARAEKLSTDGGRICVYKMGPKGAVTFSGKDRLETGIFAANALKPTGAGDSFLAGLLTGLDEGKPLLEAVLRGSACASIVVSRPGCAPAMPTPAELDEFLDKNQPTPLSGGA